MEPIYIQSHRVYLTQRVPGKHWRRLGDALEYDLATTNDFIVECGGEPLLLLRAASSVQSPIRRVVVRVTTHKGERKRQLAPVRVDNIGGDVVEIPLPGMPVEWLSMTKAGIVSAYDTVTVELLEQQVGMTNEVFDHPPVDFLYPTYTDYLNGNFERRWGELWNLDELVSGRDRFGEMVRGRLLHWHENLSWRRPRGAGGLRRLVANGITQPRVLNLIFRALLASGLVGLDSSNGYTWRWRVVMRDVDDEQRS